MSVDVTSWLIGLGAWFFVLAAASALAAVLSVVGLWKLLDRLGKPGWAALVPFYGTWVLFGGAGVERNLKIGAVACQAASLALALTGLGGGVVVASGLAGLAFVVLYAVACDAARRKLGQKAWMTVLMVAVPFVGLPMAGFSGDPAARERAAVRQMERSRRRQERERQKAVEKASARPNVKAVKGSTKPKANADPASKGTARRSGPTRSSRPRVATAADSAAGRRPASAKGGADKVKAAAQAQARSDAQARFYDSLDLYQQMEFDMLQTDKERRDFYKRTMAGRSNG